MGTTAEKLSYLRETKNAIREAIISAGGTVGDSDTFRSYAEKIENMESSVRVVKSAVWNTSKCEVTIPAGFRQVKFMAAITNTKDSLITRMYGTIQKDGQVSVDEGVAIVSYDASSRRLSLSYQYASYLDLYAVAIL